MTRSPPVSVDKPALLVDIDGVISIHGWPPGEAPAGRWLTVDGIVHFISASAAGHLQELARSFELWWCSGWEEKANEHLLGPLGLAGPLPYVGFDVAPRRGGAHWKLAAIDSALGAERPLAWVDDHLDDACADWARARRGPTLLVATVPERGLEQAHGQRLLAWAAEQQPGTSP